MYKQDLALNNLQWLISHKTKPNPIYLICMYKENLELNNLQWLICHKTKPNHIYLIYMYKEDLSFVMFCSGKLNKTLGFFDINRSPYLKTMALSSGPAEYTDCFLFEIELFIQIKIEGIK